MKQFKMLLLAGVIVLFTACGGGSSHDAGTFNGAENEIEYGVKLPGEHGLLASEVLYDYDPDITISDEEIAVTDSGAKFLLTQLGIAFTKSATVGEINTLLDDIKGMIIGMHKGVNHLVVKMSNPGSFQKLETLIKQVESNTVVRYVIKSSLPEPAALPGNYMPPDQMDLSLINHLLAIRAPAGWNARNALEAGSPPLIIVDDYFGGGVPNSDFDFHILEPVDFHTGGPISEHGYHVAGIIGATFEGSSDPRDKATGIYPGQLPIRVVDHASNLGSLKARERIIKLARAWPGKVIVNSSLSTPCDPSPCDESMVEPYAWWWIEKVRSFNLETKLLHATSAGNFDPPHDTWDGRLNSDYNAAAKIQGLTDAEGNSLENLKNTVIVENRQHSYNDPNKPGCLYAGKTPPKGASKFFGDVSAVGTNVYSLTGPNSGAGNKSGTSMAAPQVAGLAAYIWSVDPSLTPRQIINKLRATARTLEIDASCFNKPSPVIDAYAAILSADNASGEKVRKVILDVAAGSAGEGSDLEFNEYDIELFLSKLNQSVGELDYSRYDLNGDGYTGGYKAEKFDLDIDQSYGIALQQISGQLRGWNLQQTVEFDEEMLSDEDILCYYSYSSLYTGDSDERDKLILEKCLRGLWAYYEIYDDDGQIVDRWQGIEAPIDHGYSHSCSMDPNYYQGECIPKDRTPVNWAWGDNFKVIWNGYIVPYHEGTLRVSGWFDGVVSINVDSNVLIDINTTGSLANNSIDISDKNLIPIKLGFEPNGGSNNMMLGGGTPVEPDALKERRYLRPKIP